MQSKIALTLLPDGSLAEPVPGSGAPTTHILKVPDQDHLRDASLEYEAMQLSHAAGFSTADVSLLPFAGIEVLLVTRFDRALDRDGRIVRIHQEDFAQALGLPSLLKYERRGVPVGVSTSMRSGEFSTQPTILPQNENSLFKRRFSIFL
ncbi:HipA domain-containing protein [Rhizobium sp. AN63]|uniref:HipA domain-containing protein n=1 Tax=Rhizobium sp. AN63 TaxID=3035210 RepID=UPI0035A0396D